MIFGFGFGSPLISIVMLIVTSLISYGIFRITTGRRRKPSREELRRYYHEQRRIARKMSREYDLTDEEIERRIDDEL